jgi:hypothetical protein
MDFGIVLGDINKTIFRCETCIKAHAKTHDYRRCKNVNIGALEGFTNAQEFKFPVFTDIDDELTGCELQEAKKKKCTELHL